MGQREESEPRKGGGKKGRVRIGEAREAEK